MSDLDRSVINTDVVDKTGSKKLPGAGCTAVILLSVMFFWAVSFPLLIWALAEIPPFTLAAIRFVLLMPFAAAYLHYTTGISEAVHILKSKPLPIIALAITTVAIPNITQNVGMALNESSSISSILQSSGTVFTVILAFCILHERITPIQTVGLCLGLIGSILLATDGFTVLTGGTFIGNILVLASTVSYAVSGVIGKKALGDGQKPSFLICWSVIIGALILVPACAVDFSIKFSPNAWFIALALALIPSFAAYLLWYRVMEYTPLSKMAISVYVVPVIAVVLSYILLNENLTIRMMLFGALTLSGVILAASPFKKRRIA